MFVFRVLLKWSRRTVEKFKLKYIYIASRIKDFFNILKLWKISVQTQIEWLLDFLPLRAELQIWSKGLLRVGIFSDLLCRFYQLGPALPLLFNGLSIIKISSFIQRIKSPSNKVSKPLSWNGSSQVFWLLSKRVGLIPRISYTIISILNTLISLIIISNLLCYTRVFD